METKVAPRVQGLHGAPSPTAAADQPAPQAPSYAALHSPAHAGLDRDGASPKPLRSCLRKPGDGKQKALSFSSETPVTGPERAAGARHVRRLVALDLSESEKPADVIKQWLKSKEVDPKSLRPAWSDRLTEAARMVLDVARQDKKDSAWVKSGLSGIFAAHADVWRRFEEEAVESSPNRLMAAMARGTGDSGFDSFSKESAEDFICLLQHWRKLTDAFPALAPTLAPDLIEDFFRQAIGVELSALAKLEEMEKGAGQRGMLDGIRQPQRLQQILAAAVRPEVDRRCGAAAVAGYRNAVVDVFPFWHSTRRESFSKWLEKERSSIATVVDQAYRASSESDKKNLKSYLSKRLVDGQVRSENRALSHLRPGISAQPVRQGAPVAAPVINQPALPLPDAGLALKLAAAQDAAPAINRWLNTERATKSWSDCAPVAIRTVLEVARDKTDDWTSGALKVVLESHRGVWVAARRNEAHGNHERYLLAGLRATTETFCTNAKSLEPGIIKEFLQDAWLLQRDEEGDLWKSAPWLASNSFATVIPLQQLLVGAAKSGMNVEGCGAIVAGFRSATYDVDKESGDVEFHDWVKAHGAIILKAGVELYGDGDDAAVARTDFTRALNGRLIDGQVRPQAASRRQDAKGAEADG